MTAPHLVTPDSPERWAVARRLVEEYAASLRIDLGFQDLTRELESLSTAYGPPFGGFLLATKAEAFLGCGGFRKVTASDCEMKRLYVVPAGRGAGVGAALAGGLIEEARRAGYRRMLLDSLPSMAPAQALYRSLGFRPTTPYRYNPVPGTTFMELPLEAGVAGATGAEESEGRGERSPGRSRDAIEALVTRFCSCTLPREAWTHAAHLSVGLWHVDRFGADEALGRMRVGIRTLNESFGNVNSATSGYHETITCAYIRLLSAFLDACPADTPLHQRLARMLDGPMAERDILMRFYTRETLMSPRARAEWVEPDLAPIRL